MNALDEWKYTQVASDDQENLGISLTDTTPLEDLFNKSNLNIDKELDGFYEPTLFDDYLLTTSTTLRTAMIYYH